MLEAIHTVLDVTCLLGLVLVHRSLSKKIQSVVDELNRPMPAPLAEVWKPARKGNN